MACLWAAKLWNTPHVTELILLMRRQEQQEALESAKGIRLYEGDKELFAPVRGALISQLRTPISHLLVCTKAQDVEIALASVAHLFDANTCIVLLQNGVKVQEKVCRLYTSQMVYALSTSQGAYLSKQFEVVHAGFGQSYLGLLSPLGRHTSHSPKALLQLLPSAELNIQWDENITSRLWKKFAINCAINALTVIHNCRNAELLRNQEINSTLKALCQEIEFILRHCRECPSIADVYSQVETVIKATAENISSTLQDARLGRPTEFTHFNPYLCELAQKYQLPNPINERVIEQFTANLARVVD